MAIKKVDESLRKVSMAIRKVNPRSSGCTESWRRLTEGRLAARKGDGRSFAYTKVDEI